MRYPLKFKTWNKFGISKPRDIFYMTSCSKVPEFYPEETIFLQFIGLLDKNSQEIYEGDIISFNDGLKWKILDVRDNYQLEGLKRNFPEDTWEVVGNIYENPEILPV